MTTQADIGDEIEWKARRPVTAPAPEHEISPRQSILIVDDDPQIRLSLRKVLRNEGYETVLAADGREAIKKHDIERVDLVLLDLNLPINSGWDAFGTLTARDPLLPIIIITGRQKQSDLAAAAGISALMEKPLNVSLLLLTIADLLAERPETRLERMVGLRQDMRFVPPSRQVLLNLRSSSRGDISSRHKTMKP